MTEKDKLNEKTEKKSKIMQSETEAWAEIDHYEDGQVSIPSEDAVDRAKEWVEDNEK